MSIILIMEVKLLHFHSQNKTELKGITWVVQIKRTAFINLVIDKTRQRMHCEQVILVFALPAVK